MFRLAFCLLLLSLAFYELSPLFLGDDSVKIESLRTMGELWSALSPDTFQLLQPAIERHLWEGPLIWDSVVLPILLLPLWQFWSGLAFLSLLLFLLRPPRSRSRF